MAAMPLGSPVVAALEADAMDKEAQGRLSAQDRCAIRMAP